MIFPETELIFKQNIISIQEVNNLLYMIFSKTFRTILLRETLVYNYWKALGRRLYIVLTHLQFLALPEKHPVLWKDYIYMLQDF